MPPTNRANCARELLNSLNIPSYELADLIGIRGARVSDFRTGKLQPAALESKIVDAIYHVARVWDRTGYRVPLHELAVAEANLEYQTALETELVRRTATTVTT